MARRRGGGGGPAVNPILTAYMNHLLAQQRAEQQHGLDLERMREQQSIDTAQTFLPAIREGSMMPGALPPELAARLGGTDVIAGMMPSQTALEGPAREQLRQAKTQADVPDIQTLIAERAKKPITELGPLTGTLQARASRLDQIGNDQAFQDDRSIAVEGGKVYERAKMENRAANEFLGDRLNRDTMEQQNKNVLEQTQFEAMTPFEVDRAGQVAAAQEAEQRQIVSGTGPDGQPLYSSVPVTGGQGQAIEGVAPFPPASATRRPTDAQARAAGMYPILLDADKTIRAFEDRRVDLGFGTQTLSSIPGGSYWLNSDQKGLMQGANAYLNVASLILTGVTARPDEYSRFLATYIGYAGDDDLVRNRKRRSRELFNESVRQRAEGGGAPVSSLAEIMDEVDRQVAQEEQMNSFTPSYPGEPPPLPDGIPEPESREERILRLQELQRRFAQ